MKEILYALYNGYLVCFNVIFFVNFLLVMNEKENEETDPCFCVGLRRNLHRSSFAKK